MKSPLLPEVTVNGVEISPAAIAAEAQNHPAPQGKPGLAWRAAARALALREVLLQEARARGLQAEGREIAPGQIETEDEALIRGLMEVAISPRAPDQADLRALYAANPDRFRAPDLWEASHILLPVAPGDPAARTQALTLGRDLAALLAREPGRFAGLAAQHSACSSRSIGGLLGQIGPGDTVPEFEAALQGLRPGQITPKPVETRFGLHLIRLDAHARGEVLPFDAVHLRLRDAAIKAAWTRAAREFAADLMAAANVTGLGAAQVPA